MNIQQIDSRIKQLQEEKERLMAKETTNKDKIVWTKIPELKIEISQQVYNGKTYGEILKLVKEEQIVTSDMLFKLRELTDKYPQFIDFWTFVPNPDKISKENNYVAWFVADSGGAYFYCDRGPAGSDSSLGCFLYRRIKNAK